MTLSRPLALGGGLILFVLLILWMLPPTSPKGGPVVSPIPHAVRAAPSTDTLPAPDADFAVPSPSPPPVDRSAEADTQPAPRPRAPDAMYDGYSAAPDQDRASDAPAYADPQEEFDRGYRWAEQRQAEDPRECRRWADTPREDGCLAYLQDMRERSDDAADDEEEQ